MAPLKTKKLSDLDEHAVVVKDRPRNKLCRELKARQTSTRMVVKMALDKAKKKPRTTMANPVMIDYETADPKTSHHSPQIINPLFTPHKQNLPITPQKRYSPPSVGSDPKDDSSQQVEKPSRICPSQARFRGLPRNTTPPRSQYIPPPNPTQQIPSNAPLRSNSHGPQGSQGPQGSYDPQGSQGPQGSYGPQGPHCSTLQRTSSQTQQSNPLPRGPPPPPSFQEFSLSLNVPNHHSKTNSQFRQPSVPELNEAMADQHHHAAQQNMQVPEKPKSIRVKLDENIEEENRYRKGLVNGLKLEIHCHTMGGKVKVEKDLNTDSPANENVRSLLTHDIGAYIKDRMPMLAATYSKLPKKYRDDMTNHLARHFELPENETWLWDFIWRISARRYSNWKCHCHAFYKEEKGEIPAEFVWRPEQWAWLCEHFKDPKFIAKSIHCGNIRKNGKRLNHHLGKMTLKARAKKFARENHFAPHIAAFEEAYSADLNGSMLVTQVKDKLQQLMDDRFLIDPGSVYDPVPEEDQFVIINDVLREYKGTDTPSQRSKRSRAGPTVAELRAELERSKAESEAKEAEYKAREAESRAALEDVQARMKAIEDMMRGGFGANGLGVTAPSDGASFIPSNFINLP